MISKAYKMTQGLLTLLILLLCNDHVVSVCNSSPIMPTCR